MGGKLDQIKVALKRRRLRQGKRRGDRIARSVKLVLLPCLCDLNEPTTGRRALMHARERSNVSKDI
jgi:hypothetical protein